MAPTIVILANGFARPELASWLGPAATPIITSLVHDTIAVARSVRGARLVLRYGPALPHEALAGLGPDVRTAPIRSLKGADLAVALADAGGAGGPAILVGADLPHLPSWRLRDALTHLADGADLVVGPSEQGDWYLLGLRAAAPELLEGLPGLGESPAALMRAAAHHGHAVAALPPWFGIRTRDDLGALAEALRTMPQGVAVQTRSLLEGGLGFARAVGG